MLHEYGRYVHDIVRNEALATAIRRQVRPGDVVVDLGCGFGLLALVAARAGARRVYAIEQLHAVVDLAREIATDNGLADRIVFLEGNSWHVDLDERVDLVVAELFGQFALDEFMVGYLADATARWLKPGGAVLPRSCRLWVAPVELPSQRKERTAFFGPEWRDVLGFDLSRLRQRVFENDTLPYTAHRWSVGDALLGPPQQLHGVDLTGPSLPGSQWFDATFDLPVDRPGRLDGILGWFEADLGADVRLSTSPLSPPTHWGQVVFPIAPSRHVDPSSSVRMRCGFLPGGRWLYAPEVVAPAAPQHGP